MKFDMDLDDSVRNLFGKKLKFILCIMDLFMQIGTKRQRHRYYIFEVKVVRMVKFLETLPTRQYFFINLKLPKIITKPLIPYLVKPEFK